MLTFDEVVALVASPPKPLLVAIDGLPLSGKTSLAQQIIEELGAECLFDFVRYDEFVDAVRSLAHNRCCSFHPYNWETGRIESELSRNVVIGVFEKIADEHSFLTAAPTGS